MFYMDETVIPLHQETGVNVVGTFTVLDNDDNFIWIRRFQDTADRERILHAVHHHPRYAAVVDTFSALAGRTDSTVRLKPTPGSRLNATDAYRQSRDQ